MSSAWHVRLRVALVAVGVLGLAWALTRDEPPEVPIETFAARATVSPRTHLFADPVVAEVEVELDKRRVDPDSVAVARKFSPYTVVGATRSERSAGNALIRSYRYTLVCVSTRCLPRNVPRALRMPRAEVRYALRGGATKTVSAPWQPIEIGSRVASINFTRIDVLGIDFTRIDVSPAWRGDTEPPPVSFRTRPALISAGLYALAALAALAALLLLAPELRRLLRLAPRRRKDPLAGLSPLQRALALLERALAANDSEAGRKALDRLARELGRQGDDELAVAARRMAWSPPVPRGDEVGALAGAVERTIGGRA